LHSISVDNFAIESLSDLDCQLSVVVSNAWLDALILYLLEICLSQWHQERQLWHYSAMENASLYMRFEEAS
jgi:hypothetical protein